MNTTSHALAPGAILIVFPGPVTALRLSAAGAGAAIELVS